MNKSQSSTYCISSGSPVLYDEVRRFLRSAAVQAARDTAMTGLSDASVGGLIQVIIDNFDAVIHSQNCRLDCHNLAMIVTQATPTPVSDDVTQAQQRTDEGTN